MEQQKVDFEATDITFHGRDLRLTQSFERAQERARRKGSKEVRVYGTPRFVMDPETRLIYLGYQFSRDIVDRMISGQLAMPKGIPMIISKEDQERLAEKQKRELKNSTKVWRAS